MGRDAGRGGLGQAISAVMAQLCTTGAAILKFDPVDTAHEPHPEGIAPAMRLEGRPLWPDAG